MSAAAPRFILYAAKLVRSVLECCATLTADYLARKAIPNLVLVAALCHILFHSVSNYQSSNNLEILLADNSQVMICNEILVNLPVIHTTMKRLIGKCFLKICVACVILVFKNSENTALTPVFPTRRSNLI